MNDDMSQGIAPCNLQVSCPAVLLGGGPSLLTDLTTMATKCPEAHVFAVNHWYQRIDPPIRPHAVFFKDRACWPLLRNGLTGESIICPFPELANEALYNHMPESSPNVRTAIDAARWLTTRGYGPIYLCGMDCSRNHFGDEEILEATEEEQYLLSQEWKDNLPEEVHANLIAVGGPLKEYFYA